MQMNFMKTKKILKLSIGSIAIISLLISLYSFLKNNFSLKLIFNANYIMACIIILYGLIVFFAPINLRKTNRVVDHSNITEVLRDEKDKKISAALESIFWGSTNIIMVGVIEIVILYLF